MYTFKKEGSWREHQADFILTKRKKALKNRFFTRLIPCLLVGLVLVGSWRYVGIGDRVADWLSTRPAPETQKAEAAVPPPPRISRSDLQKMIRDIDFLNSGKSVFFVDTPEESFRIATSLDADLTAYLTSVLDQLKSLTRGKPRQIAMVVMDATNGRLLSMAGFDLENPGTNPCTRTDYPAASIFKIVTAAAAADALGYTPHTPLYFNGNKYTLYKRQLKETKNRYTVKTSFAKAFADSINPVFGKIGKNYLGRKKLAAYADNFGFNQFPGSDIAFEPGRFSVKDSDYHLAELGCGFNHDTRISPVFGAMMVTAVLNAGQTLIPAVVEKVTDSSGETIYKHRKEFYKTAMAAGTADTMTTLMAKTVSSGTARKSFRGYSRDKVLSTLTIGGKTGSLYNRQHTIKYDWFIGFGKEKKGGRAIAVSVVVGHGKYIGTRASIHAKLILKKYFSPKKDALSG